MQEIPIRSRGRRRLARGVLALSLTALFSSCATQKPQTALVNDPDAQQESSIPWNRPQKWESGAAFPGGASPFGAGAVGNPTGY